MAEFLQESIVFLVRVQCRRKESSRSLSHLLMSFLFLQFLRGQNRHAHRLTDTETDAIQTMPASHRINVASTEHLYSININTKVISQT